MSKTVDGQECWFLTGSQALYGEETLQQVAAQSREIAALLDASERVPLPVVWKPVLTDAEGIRRRCLEANDDDRCVGVIVWMHTFSPAKSWIAGLDLLRKPLLHLHTQANVALPWSTIDMDFMNLNQAAHGDRELAYLETRLALRRKTVVGHAGDESVQRRVAAWQRAASGWAEARHLRVVRFGDNMRRVAVTEGDKVEAELRLGVAVDTYGVHDLAAEVEGVDDKTESQVVEEYLDLYDVSPELQPGGARHGSLCYAARLEVGIRSFLDSHGAKAFTTNFEDLGPLRQLPGIAVQRLMADGYGFGGEGDWKTAILVRLLKTMGEGLPGGVSFMEDYTYHFGPGTPKVLGAHMLEVCPTIAAGRPCCEIHPLSIGAREDPVRLVFDAATGPGFVTGLLDLGDRFRMVLNEIELVSPDEPLARLPVGRAVWEPRPSLSVAAECWLTAGGPHHTALATSVELESVVDLAEIAGLELVRIGADSSAERLRQELRWNQAYYRLASGLAR